MARNAVRIAKTVDELRSAQALLLPLELGLSLLQTAITICRSKGKTCTLHTNYCKRTTGRMAAPVAKRNLRNRANRSLEEERALLQEVFDSAGVGGVLVVPPFADKLRQKMGVPLSLYRSVAHSLGITHRPVNLSAGIRVIAGIYHIQNVNAYDSRLKQWMKRFHGVAQVFKKLSGLRRWLERWGEHNSPIVGLQAALGRENQFQLLMQT
ncbi:hypothetical protein SAMN05421754_10028 [Nitrosomonas sp. Nm58]|nr:hypothetical protein SAMN05421754_10028 [Nitrosomonas sp. Nm58]